MSVQNRLQTCNTVTTTSTSTMNSNPSQYRGSKQINLAILSFNMGNAQIMEMESFIPKQTDCDVLVIGLQEAFYQVQRKGLLHEENKSEQMDSEINISSKSSPNHLQQNSNKRQIIEESEGIDLFQNEDIFGSFRYGKNSDSIPPKSDKYNLFIDGIVSSNDELSHISRKNSNSNEMMTNRISTNITDSSITPRSSLIQAVSHASSASNIAEKSMSQIKDTFTDTGGTHHLLNEIKNILGSNFEMKKHRKRGQMHLLVYTKVGLEVSDIEWSAENTGLFKMLPNKGGLCVTMTIEGTTFAFLSCHITAHEGRKNCDRRNESIQDILRGVRCGDKRFDITTQFQHVFVFGDLNYRLAHREGHDMFALMDSSESIRNSYSSSQAARSNQSDSEAPVTTRIASGESLYSEISLSSAVTVDSADMSSKKSSTTTTGDRDFHVSSGSSVVSDFMDIRRISSLTDFGFGGIVEGHEGGQPVSDCDNDDDDEDEGEDDSCVDRSGVDKSLSSLSDMSDSIGPDAVAREAVMEALMAASSVASSAASDESNIHRQATRDSEVLLDLNVFSAHDSDDGEGPSREEKKGYMDILYMSSEEDNPASPCTVESKMVNLLDIYEDKNRDLLPNKHEEEIGFVQKPCYLSAFEEKSLQKGQSARSLCMSLSTDADEDPDHPVSIEALLKLASMDRLQGSTGGSLSMKALGIADEATNDEVKLKLIPRILVQETEELTAETELELEGEMEGPHVKSFSIDNEDKPYSLPPKSNVSTPTKMSRVTNTGVSIMEAIGSFKRRFSGTSDDLSSILKSVTSKELSREDKADSKDEKHSPAMKRRMKFVLTMIAEQAWEKLLEYDELEEELREGRVLVGFNALKPNFPPTFKRKRGQVMTAQDFEGARTDEEEFAISAFQREAQYLKFEAFYNQQRTPAYCDRILFKSLPGVQDNITVKSFRSCEDVASSDHKPICAEFSINIGDNNNNNTVSLAEAEAQKSPKSQTSRRNSHASNRFSFGILQHLPQTPPDFRLSLFGLRAMDLNLFKGSSHAFSNNSLTKKLYIQIDALPSTLFPAGGNRTKLIIAADSNGCTWTDCLRIKLRPMEGGCHYNSSHVMISLWLTKESAFYRNNSAKNIQRGHGDDQLVGTCVIAAKDIIQRDNEPETRFDLPLLLNGIKQGSLEGFIQIHTVSRLSLRKQSSFSLSSTQDSTSGCRCFPTANSCVIC